MTFVRFCAVSVTAFLTACSGGGGTTSSDAPAAPATEPPAVVAPVVPAVKCPNGSSAATTAECPLPKVLSTTVAQGGVVSPDTVQAITVTTDSILDPKSVVAALWTGAIDVPGNAVAGTVTTTEKSYTFTFAVKLNYGGQYGYRSKVKDTLGRPIEVSPDFSTTTRVCTGDTAWSDNYGTCVTPVGMQTVGVNQLQDASCVSTEWAWNKTCFIDAIRNGTIKIADTSVKANGHAVIFLLFADATGADVILAFDAADPKKPVLVGGNMLAGLAVTKINWAIGNPQAILANLVINLAGVNYQFHFDTSTNTFVGVKL